MTLFLVPSLDGPKCAARALTPRELLLQDVVAVVHWRRRRGHAVRLHHVHAAAAVVVVLDAVCVSADLDHRLHADGVAAVKVLINSALSVKMESKNDKGKVDT